MTFCADVQRGRDSILTCPEPKNRRREYTAAGSRTPSLRVSRAGQTWLQVGKNWDSRPAEMPQHRPDDRRRRRCERRRRGDGRQNGRAACCVIAPTAQSSVTRQKSGRATYCARTSPLPLLPSGPGGVGGITSRRTRHICDDSIASRSSSRPLRRQSRRRLWLNLAGCWGIIGVAD